uniref:Uncharacterized protein n=1 Tax=Bracon brevicornis TaxID=1563983 RepID=A0A6V7LIZ3_9HYME
MINSHVVQAGIAIRQAVVFLPKYSVRVLQKGSTKKAPMCMAEVSHDISFVVIGLSPIGVVSFTNCGVVGDGQP